MSLMKMISIISKDSPSSHSSQPAQERHYAHYAHYAHDAHEGYEKDSTPLVVFTDGACTNNGRANAKAAYACVWPDYPQYNTAVKVPQSETQTNNRAEYRAFLHALVQAENVLDITRKRQLHVYTDSKLMIDSFTKWIHGWKQKQWRKADGSPVANLDLLQVIDQKMKHRSVVFKHVRAHTGKRDWESLHNDTVDKLARGAIL